MNTPIPFQHCDATPPNRSPLRGFPILLLALTLPWFVFSPAATAQLSPAPDGGYPNRNTAEGEEALFSVNLANNGGYNNVAIGWRALYNNTTGSDNIGIGESALFSNTIGVYNTAVGEGSLAYNTTGIRNTASGAAALQSNTTGEENTATGADALGFNTTGSYNTAAGWEALVSNTIGSNNTATGAFALQSNRGSNNTANGVQALDFNTTGNFNTADGFNALFANTIGINNTASGSAALASNTTGSGNIAIGRQAGVNLTTGNNNIDIGSTGVAGEANKIRIGKTGTQTATFIAGIRGVTVASGLGVVVSSNGQLGTVTSSARFKEAIKAMDKKSEAVLSLHPVTFRYKQELDPDKTPQFGLVAEQVEKVNPDLVVRGEDGKVMTVRYEAVNAMLLNEFLKEHRRAEQQRKQFEEKLAQQQKRIEALTATVQKVSDRIALTKPTPHFVANP